MQTFGVGVIGMGFMGKTHSYGYAALPFYYPDRPYKTSLIGACNRSLPAAEYARDELGFGYATDDENRIIYDPSIDIVHICTPNNAHYEQVKKALAAGKHVYCDKPLTTEYAQAAGLAAIARTSGKICQVVFNYRFLPATLRAKQLISDGMLGDIICFRCNYLHSGSISADKGVSWRYEPGGGTMRDLGSHAIDLMYYLLGEFDSVVCDSRILHAVRKGKNGVAENIVEDDHVAMLVRLPSGTTGTIEATKISTGNEDDLRFEIHGSRGAVRFNLDDPNHLEYFDNTLPDSPLGGMRGFVRIECMHRYDAPGDTFPGGRTAIGWLRSHCHSLFCFLESVYNNTHASPNFDDGAYVQRIIDCAFQSVTTGAWVKL